VERFNRTLVEGWTYRRLYPTEAAAGPPSALGCTGTTTTGPVRLVHGLGDLDRFQPGEMLVVRATAPVWTPLLARTAAVVTDGGILAAHASLVARQYGIPCRGRHRRHHRPPGDGQVVTVSGGADTVELHR
jgi:pyruvate,water dikinase